MFHCITIALQCFSVTYYPVSHQRLVPTEHLRDISHALYQSFCYLLFVSHCFYHELHDKWAGRSTHWIPGHSSSGLEAAVVKGYIMFSIGARLITQGHFWSVCYKQAMRENPHIGKTCRGLIILFCLLMTVDYEMVKYSCYNIILYTLSSAGNWMQQVAKNNELMTGERVNFSKMILNLCSSFVGKEKCSSKWWTLAMTLTQRCEHDEPPPLLPCFSWLCYRSSRQGDGI